MNNIPGTPMMGLNDSWYLSGYGLQIPPNLPLVPSGNKALMLDETGYYNYRGMSLEQYVKYQLLMDRRKYFILFEAFRRDTWVRATIDYITRRITRDEPRLVDPNDLANPEIEDTQEWLDNCFPDGDFQDILSGIAQDLSIYSQAYCYIERTVGGEALHLWPMDSRITFPVTDFSGAIMFHAQVYNGIATFFMPEEVLYFPLRNNGANPKSVPALDTLYESIAMESQANRYNLALFENNLNIGAVFSMTSADEDTLENNRRYLMDNYAGAKNAYTPLLLSGDAKMLRDGAMRTKDINFELLIRVRRHRVSAVFGIPESLLGIPDNTNRATSNTHERTRYANTIRPLLKRIYRRLNSQLLRRTLDRPRVFLTEPLSSMIPTKEEVDAVNAVAENGINFNDYLEMTGRPRVANGDYWIMRIPGPGGLVRLDVTAMPGLDDPHFDFEAMQLQHQAQSDRAEQLTAAGLPPSSQTPFVPPRPQDLLVTEPIAARIIDMTRSDPGLETGPKLQRIISRRIPTNPGSRGSTTVYQTSSGKYRYGAPPKGPQAPGKNAGRPAPLVNPKDIPAPPGLSDQDRKKMAAAQSQVSGIFRQAQEQGWTTDQFMGALTQAGWEMAVGTQFAEAADARAAARLLAEQNDRYSYTLLGADGQYFVMRRPLDQVDETLQETASKPLNGGNAEADTGNVARENPGRLDTGNPSSVRTADTGNPMRRPNLDAGRGPLGRSNPEEPLLDDWVRVVRSFVGEL